jgi:hypothetical protein
MSDTKMVENEPYMGVINVGRVSGRASLFDSDVEHQHFISVSISKASRERNLSMNWIHGGDELVEVWMSEIQWAHFVSSFNQGAGTPVTLRHVAGKTLAEPPRPKAEATKFEKEVTDTVKDAMTSLGSAISKLEAGLIPKAKAPNKGDLTEILANLRMAYQEINSNIGFVESQFGEHIEKKMAEAKCEFEGYMTSRLRALGLEAAALSAAAADAPKPQFMIEGSKKG